MKTAEVGSAFQIQNDARVLDRLPSGLQKEPVLRVHVGRFARRNSKELRIELVDSVDKSPAPGDGFARRYPARDRRNARDSSDPEEPRRQPRGLRRGASKVIQCR